jgi:hypothetical protein
MLIRPKIRTFLLGKKKAILTSYLTLRKSYIEFFMGSGEEFPHLSRKDLNIPLSFEIF